MEREARHRVRAGFDGDAGQVELPHEGQHLLPRRAVLFVHPGRHRQIPREEAAADLDGQPIGDGAESHRHHPRTVEEHALEDAERRIQRHVPIAKQLDELAHCRRSQIQVPGAPGWLGEARGGARIFHVGHEVEHQEVGVLNLVVSEDYRLAGGQTCRDVPGYPQALLVRRLGEGSDQLRLERAVELDLHHSQGGVLVDPLAPRLFVRHQHLGGSLVRPRPVHEAGHDDAGADLGPFLDALLARQELVDVVGQVADRGHARGEVQQPVVGADVRVHVPEAWDQRLSRRLDHFGARWGRGRRSHGDNSVAVDHHVLVGNDAGALGVEDRGVVEDELASRPSRKALRLLPRPLLGRLLLRLDQLGHGGFPALAHHRLPGASGGEVLALHVQPEVHGREIEPGHRVQRHRLGLAPRLRGELPDLGDPRLPVRQQCDPPVPVQGGARQQRGLDGRTVHRGVERRSGDLA